MNCSTSKESVPGLFFSNLKSSRGGENPKSKCDINGDGLMIWPLKLSPTGIPVATLSPNNFNTGSIFAICFSKNRPFSPDFGCRVAFWRLFAKKNKNHCKGSFTFATIRYFWNNTAFSTAIQLPATRALPIPSVGCAPRHPDLPILEGGSAKKRTPCLLLYKLGLRGALLLHERIQAELTIKRFLYAWFA
jgi:hypothetical protein